MENKYLTDDNAQRLAVVVVVMTIVLFFGVVITTPSVEEKVTEKGLCIYKQGPVTITYDCKNSKELEMILKKNK